MELLKKNFKFGGITYLVCSNGDIFGPTGKQLNPRENADGYAVVTMGNKRIRRSTQFVHRVVAELFLPNPQNLSDVDHLDGNRMNPDKDNLEWVTYEENVKRAQVPIIMVDYLQIIQEDQATDKAKVDYITKSLKVLQRTYNTVVIAISSINRGNYMLPIDFEAFKESGSIEFSADVLWGLQLQILNDPAFAQAKNQSQRRKLMAMAKAASPRQVELVCLKNRYGIASYSCGFLYYAQYDLFTPDPNYKTTTMVCPTPRIII